MALQHRVQRGLRRRAGRVARDVLPPALKPALRRGVSTSRAHRNAGIVLDSGLFDAEYYARHAGCDPDPAKAARHYLVHGQDDECPAPHPLFGNDWMRRKHPHRVGKRNPLLAYLRDATLRATSQTHPLFDVERYVAAHPEAAKHRSGVTGHYMQHGAAAGFEPNDWYRPTPDTAPGGLADWIRARDVEWRERHAATSWRWSTTPPTEPQRPPVPPPPADTPPLVSVVLPSGAAVELLAEVVDGVLAQTVGDLELLVVHPPGLAAAVEAALTAHRDDERLRLVEGATATQAGALRDGVRRAVGEWVAFCVPTTPWRPEHLAGVLEGAREAGSDAAYDVVEEITGDGRHLYGTVPATTARSRVGASVNLGALVVRRAVLAELAAPDATLHTAVGYDLELRLLERGPLPLVQRIGVTHHAAQDQTAADAVPLRERPRLDVSRLKTWKDIVLDRRLVPWESIDPDGETGLVSIIVPTHADSVMTVRAVERVYAANADVEVIVVDNGCSVEDAVVLDALPLRFPLVQVLHEPVNRGFALANNIAIPYTHGATIVFLNNDTEALPGWLEPLIASLEDPDILGAQSLLVYPTGSIQSAGIAFPACGGVPHALLQGYPVEDAHGIEDAELHACTAAALAMRRADVIALHGFDPIFRNGMEDVDLGLRAAKVRPGRFTVRPDSVVVHHESRTPGRFRDSLVNRRVLLDRYGADMPGDDVRLWGERGWDVITHETGKPVSEDGRLAVPMPVVVRHRPADVVEHPPRLRWALKNPAPVHEADRWGDTHFIRSLAAALRRCGQEVVIDFRGEFERASGHHDDVVLVLRGLAPYRPMFGQISMAWLISHPEMFSRREAEAYDRVFAASELWSRRTSVEWGVRIDPLLQATDPELFHPDRGRPDTGHPVLFVGSSRKTLRPMVRDAIAEGLALSVYGDHWDDFIPKQFVKARYLPNLEVGEAYRRAGIVLNDHWEDMRVDGFLSNRLFDAVASGARVVSDDIEGIEALFGRSVQVVRTPAELAAVATAPDLDAVFGDDAERRAVAARVHAEHSFDTRAHQLVEAAAELRTGLSRSTR